MPIIVYTILIKIIRIFYSLIPFVFLSRYVDKEYFGEFLYVSMILNSFFQIASLNARTIFINKTVMIGDVYRINFLRFYISIRFLFLVFFLVFIMYEHFNFYDKWAIFISLFFYGVNFFEIGEWNLERNYQQKKILPVALIVGLFFLILKIYLILAKIKLEYITVLQSLESLCYFSCLFFISQFSLRKLLKKVSFKIVKYYIYSIFPFFTSLLMIVLYSRLDQYMIKHYVGYIDMSNYIVSKKIIDNFNIIPLSLSAISLPFLTKLKRDKGTCYEESKGYFFIFFISGLFLCILSMLFVPYITRVLFGENYNHIAFLIYINSISMAINFIGIFNGGLLLIYKKNHLILYRSLISLLINFVLNIFLIPRYGAIGASIATLVSVFVGCYFLYVIYKPTEEISKINRLGFISFSNLKSVKF